jgi:oxygen-independent coproporphyrinogen-3 oxidase
VALYGYAHVPWMSRRQQLIPPEALPTPEARLEMFDTARQLFRWDGYRDIGIDHFARPEDGLARAQGAGQLRRNFQGYTDDPSPVLIGLGASAISRFPQGYAQNAAGTAAYTKAVRAGEFATERGHRFQGEDRLRARIIEALMCDFAVARAALVRDFAVPPDRIEALFQTARDDFGAMVQVTDQGLAIPDQARPLTRMIARSFDAYAGAAARHSPAI